MKSVNNKIKKPFVSIGFDSTGSISFNLDLNKLKKLNKDNLVDLGNVFKTVVNSINNNVLNTELNIFALYYKKTGITFHKKITISELVLIETHIRNGQKLTAVKTFKEMVDCGLKDAKEFIDFYIDQLSFD